MKLTGLGQIGFNSLDDILGDSGSQPMFEGVKAKEIPLTVDAKLLSKFREIEAFFELYNRPPTKEGDLKEKTLNRSLLALKANVDFVESLHGHDKYSLLTESNVSAPSTTNVHTVPQCNNEAPNDDFLELQPPVDLESKVIEIPAFTSLDDILDFDSDDILANLGDLTIYQDENATRHTNNGAPYSDEVMGTRFECPDFWRYEPHFQKIRQALKDGSASFNQLQTEQNLFVGDIFLLQGIICFIADKFTEERKSDRLNYRLKLIFENGLESNMLMRSLARAIYKDENGRQILINSDDSLAQLFNQSIEPLPSGYIYIAQMEQVKPELQSFKHLYKVGFTRGTVEDRLLGCEDDIAFLESKVKAVAKIDCLNMDPHAFERMIHTFLYAQRLNLILKSKDGSTYKPKEWFSVDLDTILEVAQRIIDQSIIHFRMDNTINKIVPK